MKAIVFDLDGTLIHSVPDLHAAAGKMLADYNAPALDMDTIQSFVGNGVPKLVERIAKRALLSPDNTSEMTERFMGYYSADPSTLSTLFPNVVTTLHQLRDNDCLLAVCTNKPEAPARTLLADFGIDGLFHAVVGGDALDVRKPDPRHLLYTFEQMGSAPGVYVGDSETDALTAENAQVRFALYTKGYRKTPVKDLYHDVVFEDFSDLPELI